MEDVRDIISDTQLDYSFGNANFGSKSKRDVIKYSLLKYASGYSTGSTARIILKELNLLTQKETLSKKGKLYLFAAFSEGNSF